MKHAVLTLGLVFCLSGIAAADPITFTFTGAVLTSEDRCTSAATPPRICLPPIPTNTPVTATFSIDPVTFQVSNMIVDAPGYLTMIGSVPLIYPAHLPSGSFTVLAAGSNGYLPSGAALGPFSDAFTISFVFPTNTFAGGLTQLPNFSQATAGYFNWKSHTTGTLNPSSMAVTPEPSTFVLLAIGLIPAVLAVRRRRK